MTQAMVTKKQWNLANKQARAACDKYHTNYNNTLYSKAIQGKSSKYANALTDEALALCGHPYYRLSYRNWSGYALAHLERFV